ncbi:MAG: bifunctional precorrin-2 dehydrogenase/sirohydrochlorin ferrochelatase [Chloroflexales bacterium]|nr:bifunctional precorrin-2 dehydrogenase/sirohydrochlorin ferrochelatase [Chloroflexales bacterium]
MPQSSYPLVLTNLDRARCVVVGGGAVAERKVAGLLEAGARPLVISPTLTMTLSDWWRTGRIDHLPRVYEADDLDGAALVIAATNDAAVNRQVAEDARRRGVLVNVASDPAAGSFHTVATVRRGALLLTVSTGGQSPALAARLRADLAARYGPEYAVALARAAWLRTIPDAALAQRTKQALTSWLCSEQALGWLREGSDDLVVATVERALAHSATASGEDR